MLSEQHKWLAVSGAAALLAAGATRIAMRTGWKVATGRKPPENPASPYASWGEAIGWALVTGAAASLARLMAERGSAAGWKRRTGKYPKTLKRKRAGR